MSFDDTEKQRMARLIKSARLNSDLSWYRNVHAPKILKAKGVFSDLAKLTNTPLCLGPLLMTREYAADIGAFKRYIGNGQPWNKKTTIVPKGRGPWRSWLEAAQDAYSLKSFQEISEWNLERLLFECERYNGFGYRSKGVQSPYLWSGTSNYSKGLYVSDGVFSPTSVDKNIGVFAMYQILCELDSDFALDAEAEGGAEGTTQEAEKDWLKTVIALVQKIADILLGQLLTPSPAKKADAPQVEIELSLKDRIRASAPGINRKMLDEFFEKHWGRPGIDRSGYIVFVDFTLPSTEKRMWIVGAESAKVWHHCRVAHGKGSDQNNDGIATWFGSVSGSGMSELGLYLLGKKRGWKDKGPSKFDRSRWLVGQDATNKNAVRRAVVWHDASYVTTSGSVGRSLGCPATPRSLVSLSQFINDTLPEGTAWFHWHNSPAKNETA